jgi:hypothetical protein
VDTCGADRWNRSGFLLSPTLALTAHHVLADASKVRVVFDHKVVNARVGRVDRTSDLALLGLDEPVAGHVFDLAASSSMTGAQVGVIGFPLDEPKTLTVGTVSGLDREVTTETGSYTQMLRTDTAINLGSSGVRCSTCTGGSWASRTPCGPTPRGSGSPCPPRRSAGCSGRRRRQSGCSPVEPAQAMSGCLRTERSPCSGVCA